MKLLKEKNTFRKIKKYENLYKYLNCLMILSDDIFNIFL